MDRVGLAGSSLGWQLVSLTSRRRSKSTMKSGETNMSSVPLLPSLTSWRFQISTCRWRRINSCGRVSNLNHCGKCQRDGGVETGLTPPPKKRPCIWHSEEGAKFIVLSRQVWVSWYVVHVDHTYSDFISHVGHAYCGLYMQACIVAYTCRHVLWLTLTLFIICHTDTVITV